MTDQKLRIPLHGMSLLGFPRRSLVIEQKTETLPQERICNKCFQSISLSSGQAPKTPPRDDTLFALAFATNSGALILVSSDSTRLASLGVLAVLVLAAFLAVESLRSAETRQPLQPSPQSTLGNWPPALGHLFGPSASNPRIQFGLSFWAISDFATLTGGLSTVTAYKNAIQKYFLPHNIYWVPIYQYGDANVSSSCLNTMCLQPEVNNLLTAGDAFGMHFLFWF